MKKSLRNKLKVATVGMAALGLTLLPQNLSAEKEDIGFGAGNLRQGAVNTNPLKLNLFIYDPPVTAGINFLVISHRLDNFRDYDSYGSEIGVEFEMGFLNKDSLVSPYAGFNFGISEMDNNLVERYYGSGGNNFNKSLGLFGGLSLHGESGALNLTYQMRHISELSRLSFEDGLETYGIFLSGNVNF